MDEHKNSVDKEMYAMKIMTVSSSARMCDGPGGQVAQADLWSLPGRSGFRSVHQRQLKYIAFGAHAKHLPSCRTGVSPWVRWVFAIDSLREIKACLQRRTLGPFATLSFSYLCRFLGPYFVELVP